MLWLAKSGLDTAGFSSSTRFSFVLAASIPAKSAGRFAILDAPDWSIHCPLFPAETKPTSPAVKSACIYINQSPQALKEPERASNSQPLPRLLYLFPGKSSTASQPITSVSVPASFVKLLKAKYTSPVTTKGLSANPLVIAIP